MTILAFVFVPISLSTSIFGMNVQEINSSGHDVWIFVVTTIVLVGLALAAWGLAVIAPCALANARLLRTLARKGRKKDAQAFVPSLLSIYLQRGYEGIRRFETDATENPALTEETHIYLLRKVRWTTRNKAMYLLGVYRLPDAS